MSETEHGIKLWRRGCRCDVCRDAKRAYERKQYEQRIYGTPSAKPSQEAVQLKLFVETQIRLLTKNGASRELIHQTTKAPWDLVCDTLAELWDRGEVKIERRGEDRLFYLRRAA